MSVFKKTAKDAAREAGILSGNFSSQNAQNAADAAVEGMDYFRAKVASSIIQNGDFAQGKGNLFEYIEAAKFNVDAAGKGAAARAVVTDIENPQAAADILIKEGSRTRREVQAKFVQTYKNGRDVSASKSVFDQVGGQKGHYGKYKGMDRLIRKQDDYNSDGSLLQEAKKLAKMRADSGSMYADDYRDVYEHLTDELQYNDVNSGGTTIEEVHIAYDSPEKYSAEFEKRVVRAEMKASAANMAKASFVTTGIVSGIANMAAVIKNEKSLDEALGQVEKDAVQGAAKGAATGVVSTAIRYQGIKAGSALLSDAVASTVMAGGVIDGGVALLDYARGEISEVELRDRIIDTTAKATTTVFFSKAVTAIMGKSVNPIVPFAVYTTASYVFTATREIIKNANLQAEEYDRMAAILYESKRQTDQYKAQLQLQIAQVAENQRIIMNEFLTTFNYNLETGENYDEAIRAIVRFADQAGIALQHASFTDFSEAMKRKDVFSLE